MLDRLYSKRTRRPLMGREHIKDNKLRFVYPRRKDGSVKVLDIDQFSGQDFMENANGFICNDIMVFEQSQSDSVARAVLSRIKVLHPESYPQDLSLDDMMSMAMPANYGTPAEFVSAQKMVMERAYKMNQAALEKKAAEAAKVAAEKELFEKANVPDMSGSIPKSE